MGSLVRVQYRPPNQPCKLRSCKAFSLQKPRVHTDGGLPTAAACGGFRPSVNGSSPVQTTKPFVPEPDSLRRRVRVRFLFTGDFEKSLLRTANEQRQGIIMAMVSCLLLCGTKFTLCKLGHLPYMAYLGAIAVHVRTGRAHAQENSKISPYRVCSFLGGCGILDLVQQIGSWREVNTP